MNRRTIITIAGLLAAASLVQAWLVERASLPALDAVGFVAVAQSFDRQGLCETLRTDPSSPVFPMLVWLTHASLVGLGCLRSDDWARAAQVAAAMPLVLSVGAGWLLFRHSVSAAAATLAASFAIVTTMLARLGADGLSDSTHLLLAGGALCCMAAFLTRAEATHTSVWKAVACLAGGGALTALALLTRAESIVLPAALAGTLLIEVLIARRLAARRALLGFAAFGIGFLVIIGSYAALAQTWSPAELAFRLYGRRGPDDRRALNADEATSPVALTKPDWRLADGRPMAFGRAEPTLHGRFGHWLVGLAEFAREAAQSLNYALGLMALIGLWLAHSTIRRPIDVLLILVAVLAAACAIGVAVTQGYLAGRHLALMVWLALPWAALGTLELPCRAAAWLNDRLQGRFWRATNWAPRAAWALAAVLVIGCLATTASARHARHAPHRLAADWLAVHAEGSVLDSFGYTALFTGATTYRYAAAIEAMRDPCLAHVVVERGELTADSPRGATMRELLARCATPIVEFPSDTEHAGGAVLVFAWRPDRFCQYVGERHAR